VYKHRIYTNWHKNLGLLHRPTIDMPPNNWVTTGKFPNFPFPFFPTSFRFPFFPFPLHPRPNSLTLSHSEWLVIVYALWAFSVTPLKVIDVCTNRKPIYDFLSGLLQFLNQNDKSFFMEIEPKLKQVEQLCQRDRAKRLTSSVIRKITKLHFWATLWGIKGNTSASYEGFNAKKLCSRVSSRECQFYS